MYVAIAALRFAKLVICTSLEKMWSRKDDKIKRGRWPLCNLFEFEQIEYDNLKVVVLILVTYSKK